MQKKILLITVLIFISCGKTKLDDSRYSQSTSSSLTCSQVSTCAKDCGTSPSSSCMSNLSQGGSRQACIGIDDSGYQSCMNKKVQVSGSSYIILNN